MNHLARVVIVLLESRRSPLPASGRHGPFASSKPTASSCGRLPQLCDLFSASEQLQTTQEGYRVILRAQRFAVSNSRIVAEHRLAGEPLQPRIVCVARRSPN